MLDTIKLQTKRISKSESESQRLKSLANLVISVQEEERGRVSRELYENTLQMLTAVGINLEILRTKLPNYYWELQKHVDESISLINKTTHQIRSLANGLRTPDLDNLGLMQTLEGFCYEFVMQTAIPIEFHGEEAKNLPDAVSITLYRFLQEAMKNIAREIWVRWIWISLEQVDRNISLCLRADGEKLFLNQQPLPYDDYGLLSHFGLLEMRERFRLLEGEIEIQVDKEFGIQIKGTLPKNGKGSS